MTAPDFADWVPPQTSVAATKTLWQGTFSGSGNSPTFDTSAWAMMNIVIGSPGVGSNSVALLSVNDYGALGLIATRYYNYQSGPFSATAVSGIDAMIPILGTSCYISNSDPGGNTVNASVVGATRQQQQLVKPLADIQDGPVELSGSVTIPANSSLILGQVGPYTNGLHAAFTGAADTRMNLYTYGWEAGVATARGLGGPIGNANGYTYTDIEAPNALILATVTNTNTTTARGVNYSLSGLM